MIDVPHQRDAAERHCILDFEAKKGRFGYLKIWPATMECARWSICTAYTLPCIQCSPAEQAMLILCPAYMPNTLAAPGRHHYARCWA